MSRIPVAILGATGTVGQRFIQLLENHPWLEVTAVAASDRSVGRTYGDACRWFLSTPIPQRVREMIVHPLEPGLDCDYVFSALPSGVAGGVEEAFAGAGYTVFTNAAPHRMDPDVPLLIPEVNASHLAVTEVQQRRRGGRGLIIASANCTTTQLALALKPLHDAFSISKLSVVTMQAISGAGYPGVAAADILGNIVPHISNEEEKVETESLKLLGTLQGDRITQAPIVVSAQCNRVPVYDGHTECVSVQFENPPRVDQVVDALERFRGPREVADLPSSPEQPIVVFRDPDRPQPLRDIDLGRGMAVSVGRVRPCPVLDVKFVVLGHNTLRGAAGGSIHNAELVIARQKHIEKG
jgi:aspartate-semialdehyde dehydrogenase